MRISWIPYEAALLLSGLLALGSCTEPERPQQPGAAAPVLLPAAVPNTTPTTTLPDTTEYLDWAMARINGRLPLQGPARAAWQELGRADSVVEPNLADECTSFFSRPFRRAYVRATELELYGDTVVVTSLDLQRQPALALHAGSLHLTHATTLAELARTFPKAVSEQSPLDDYALGQVIAVSVAVSRAPADDHWLLLFKDGQLARIDYWMPC